MRIESQIRMYKINHFISLASTVDVLWVKKRYSFILWNYPEKKANLQICKYCHPNNTDLPINSIQICDSTSDFLASGCLTFYNFIFSKYFLKLLEVLMCSHEWCLLPLTLVTDGFVSFSKLSVTLRLDFSSHVFALIDSTCDAQSQWDWRGMAFTSKTPWELNCAWHLIENTSLREKLLSSQKFTEIRLPLKPDVHGDCGGPWDTSPAQKDLLLSYQVHRHQTDTCSELLQGELHLQRTLTQDYSLPRAAWSARTLMGNFHPELPGWVDQDID